MFLHWGTIKSLNKYSKLELKKIWKRTVGIHYSYIYNKNRNIILK